MSDPKQRAEHEAAFHDHIATQTRIEGLPIEDFFSAYTALENRAAMDYFGHALRGKRILDLGCGYGEAAVFFAKRGADVDAIDISQGMLDLAGKLATENGVSPRFQRVQAETLPFETGCFDCIFGNGVLHHVTLSATLPEIRRVLKPGGKAVFIEPLPYNPIINIYRRMATRYRSEDEHPLTTSQRREIFSAFPNSTHREFWLAGLLVFVWMFLAERVHPNDAPYWKKIIYDAEKYRWLAKPLIALDAAFTRVPGLRWLSWNTVVFLRK
jgi:SAM-dependent methyltransferase